MTFERTRYLWESQDDWQFADRDAERKYFYEAGQLAAIKKCEEIAAVNGSQFCVYCGITLDTIKKEYAS